MCAAERRKKVIEGHLVGDVDGRKPQGELLAIRAEQIVRPHTEIEEMTRSDARADWYHHFRCHQAGRHRDAVV